VNLNSREGNWIAAIDLENRNGSALGHRELAISAQHCSSLEESLALMVSLMVDVTRESLKQPASKLAPQARLETPRATEPTHTSAPWRGRAYLLGSLRDGQMPGLGRSITLQGEISSVQDWSASLAVALWAPGQRSEEGLGARFWLGTVEADVCGAIRSNRSSDVSLCAGYQLGILDSRAFGFDVNQHKATLIQDLVMRFRATFWATASFGFHGTLGVGLPLIQDEFFGTRTDGSTVRLMSRPPLIPLADFGMAVRFDP
jgi:hypothetical protein